MTDVWMKVGGVMQIVVERNRLRAQGEREQMDDRRYYWRKEQKQTKKHKQKTKIEPPHELKKKSVQETNKYLRAVSHIYHIL